MTLILSGRWEYCEADIMDRTNLRFFTRAISWVARRMARKSVGSGG